MLRDLVTAAVGLACADRGIQYGPANGSGREMRFLSEVDRHYRVRSGRRDTRGDLDVKVNSDSALAITDEPSLYMPESWAFVYIVDGDHRAVEIVAAEIVGKTEGTPGRPLFGEQIALGGAATPPAGFKPIEDGLDDIFPNEDEGDGEAGAA